MVRTQTRSGHSFYSCSRYPRCFTTAKWPGDVQFNGGRKAELRYQIRKKMMMESNYKALVSNHITDQGTLKKMSEEELERLLNLTVGIELSLEHDLI